MEQVSQRHDILHDFSEKERFSLGECVKSSSDRSLLLIDDGLSFQAVTGTPKTACTYL